MSDENSLHNQVGPGSTPIPGSEAKGAVTPSAGCGCASCQAKQAEERAGEKPESAGPSLVFTLGQVAYDMISEARRDSLQEAMGGPGEDPADASLWLEHLKSHPWDAASVYWTLNHDRTPIYAILPMGAYARDSYDFLVEALRRKVAGKGDARSDHVAIPGRLAGRVKLLDGTTVPALIPERRGMQPWNVPELVNRIARGDAAKRKAVGGFLDRVRHELRSRGLTPGERAINYSATNAATIGGVFDEVLAGPEAMELDEIGVEPSPTCRPGSECHDVKLYFFYPGRQVQTVRMVYRFTVDVSDVVPVMVGPIRSWTVR